MDRALSAASFGVCVVSLFLCALFLHRTLKHYLIHQMVRINSRRHVLRRQKVAGGVTKYGVDFMVFCAKWSIWILYVVLTTVLFAYVYAAPWLTPEAFQYLDGNGRTVAFIVWAAAPVFSLVLMLGARNRLRKVSRTKEPDYTFGSNMGVSEDTRV